jgi:hypothetical protein
MLTKGKAMKSDGRSVAARADIGEYFGRFSGCSLLADCRYRVVTYEACHPVPLQIPEDR